MKRFILAAGVFALAIASSAFAQDPRPGEARQPSRPRPGGFGTPQPDPKDRLESRRSLSATLALSYQENVELLEAQQLTKKAHIRGAEVAVRLTELNLAQLERAAATGVGGGKGDLEKAKLEVEAARARLEVQMGEMKELEVRIKYAKKRLEEMKNLERTSTAPRENPFRKLDRRPVDPPPPPPPGSTAGADPFGLKAVVELKRKVLVLEALIDENKATIARATADVTKARGELITMQKLYRPDTERVRNAEAKMAEAEGALEKAIAEQETNERELATARARLKEIEK